MITNIDIMREQRILREIAVNRVQTIVMAGGAGERLQPLTRGRSKASVPFGGKYLAFCLAFHPLVHPVDTVPVAADDPVLLGLALGRHFWQFRRSFAGLSRYINAGTRFPSISPFAKPL